TPLEALLVAFYVGPLAGCVAEGPSGAGADDVECAVVMLDVGVTEPHVLVGSAVGQCHGDCHCRNLRTRRRNVGRSQPLGPALLCAPIASRSPTADAWSGAPPRG